jgi:outer membrane protein assembly factor BamB
MIQKMNQKRNFMIKGCALLTLMLLFFSHSLVAKTTNDKILNNRVKIGPTINAPVEFMGKLYFLANTGVLYESNYDLSEVKDIFKTDLPSFSALTLNGDILYFGEGLHDHNKTNFYAYDLKNKKLVFKVATQGHIERPPLIQNNIAFIGLGPDGLGALDLKNKKMLWHTKTIKNGKLHVDATPMIRDQLLCSVSIYEYKGFFCLNLKDGTESYDLKMTLSPKSETGLSADLFYGYATEANMVDGKWKTESLFYIINLKEKKFVKEVKLRGYNFFAPLLISEKKVFVTISTGDLITIDLSNGAIGYVGEFPEPFISNSYMSGDALCSIGVMGQELCYRPTPAGYALVVEKRHSESPIGQIKGKINGKYYIPSRIGYFTL